MTQVNKFLSKDIDDLGKSVLARIRNRFEKSAYLGNSKPFHSSLGEIGFGFIVGAVLGIR